MRSRTALSSLAVLTTAALLVAGCSGAATIKPTEPASVAPTSAPTAGAGGPVGRCDDASRAKVGMVTHVPVPFTQQIVQGAKDAAADYNVDFEVVGPSGYDPDTAVTMLKGLISKKPDGLFVLPAPAEAFTAVFAEADKAGIPLVAANVFPTRASNVKAFFTASDYDATIGMMDAMFKAAEAKGITGGKIAVGICAKGYKTSELRLAAVQDYVAKHPGWSIVGPYETGSEVAQNYSFWESTYNANPDVVMMIGLCSFEVPNLVKLAKKSGGSFMIGGYDLEPETMEALKAGTADAAVGAEPYLQGYSAVRSLAEHVCGGTPMLRGFVNLPADVQTPATIAEELDWAADPVKTRDHYAKLMAEKMPDLQGIAVPDWPYAGE